jgi:peptidoglycan lytic transglycosylase
VRSAPINLRFYTRLWICAATFTAACFFLVEVSGIATAANSFLGQSGIASIYSSSGGPTASGEVSNSKNLTAAHRSLPFGTMVRVTNTKNGRSVVVRINDRGPFMGGRVIDLTPAAARALGFTGLTRVKLSAVGDPTR